MACLCAVGCTKTKVPPCPPCPVDDVAITGTASNEFLFISDIHYGTNQVNTDGDYSTDTGPVLWQAAQNKLDAILTATSHPAFVIYTGDIPAHYDWSAPNHGCPPPLCGTDAAEHGAFISTVLDDLYDLLPAGMPMFYAPGNNDAMGGDYFSFADANQETPFALVPKSDNYPAPNAQTPCGSAPCMLSNPDPAHGYYAAKATEKLRIIALNTVILNKFYCEVDGVKHQAAGDTMLSWFGHQLDSAANAGDQVYIIMHIPPNKWDDRKTWTNTFLKNIEAHQDRIAGILYGHTHMDEQLVFYGVKNPSQVTEVGISCPGITPLHANNPGFKTVSYDPSSMELQDFKTHWTTPGATVWGDNNYSFLEEYGQKGDSTIYEALQHIDNFNSDSILANMKEIYWVKNTDTAGSSKYFPTTVDVR